MAAPPCSPAPHVLISYETNLSVVKKLYYALVFMLLATAGHAQDKGAVTIIKKSEQLTHATGWKQNRSTDKLIANDNVICDKEIQRTDSALIGGTPQNFGWLQTASLRYGARKYYMVYYFRQDGHFLHPETKVGWISHTATRFLVVDSSEYVAFRREVLAKRGGAHTLRSRVTGEILDAYDEPALLKAVAAAFESVEKKTALVYYCFNARTQVFEGRDIARLRVPETCITSDKLGTEFFETDYESFRKLLVEP